MNIPFNEIIPYCQSKYPEEACGLVTLFKGRYKWIPCENASIGNRKNTFTIHPLDFAKASDEGEIVCIVHSHTQDASVFSQTDIAMQKKQGIPWVLIGLAAEEPEIVWLTNPKEEAPLYGRKYVWHVSDCFNFVQDWYAQEMDIHIKDFPREEKFWESGQELYLDNFEKAGFVEVPLSDLQYGDALLMHLAGNVTSHAAVYLGNNQIGHHLNGRLSSRDVYGQYYKDRTTKVVRHKEMNR